jgi:branched-chain amino acid aminotransferase
VTRDTLLTLYREIRGESAEVREVDRSELYLAEEAFVCGTGQEIIPVVSIDRLPVGDGQPGPLTRELQARYFDVVRGASGQHPEWRTVI